MSGKQTAIVIRHGYEKYLTDNVREKYLAARKSFEELNLGEELNVLRALLSQLVEQIQKPDDKGQQLLPIKESTALIKEIRETVKLMVAHQDREAIPIQIIAVYQQQVIAIIKDELKDDERVQRVAVKMGRIALPRDGREADQLGQHIREGEISLPDA